MVNELATIGGATAATGIAVGVTFGKVKAVNDACVNSAKYTAGKASKTTVRKAADTVVNAAEYVGASIATEVVSVSRRPEISVFYPDLEKTLEKEKMLAFENTIKTGAETINEVVKTVSDVADNVPVVGHVKGAVHYVCGDKEGGDRAMKSASRTTGVTLGGLAGIPAGPAGMFTGGMAGGTAVDGLTTVVESAVNGEYTPSGQFEILDRIVEAEDPEELRESIIDGITMAVTDGLLGYAVGSQIGGGGESGSQRRGGWYGSGSQIGSGGESGSQIRADSSQIVGEGGESGSQIGGVVGESGSQTGGVVGESGSQTGGVRGESSSQLRGGECGVCCSQIEGGRCKCGSQIGGGPSESDNLYQNAQNPLSGDGEIYDGSFPDISSSSDPEPPFPTNSEVEKMQQEHNEYMERCELENMINQDMFVNNGPSAENSEVIKNNEPPPPPENTVDKTVDKTVVNTVVNTQPAE